MEGRIKNGKWKMRGKVSFPRSTRLSAPHRFQAHQKVPDGHTKSCLCEQPLSAQCRDSKDHHNLGTRLSLSSLSPISWEIINCHCSVYWLKSCATGKCTERNKNSIFRKLCLNLTNFQNLKVPAAELCNLSNQNIL